MMRSMYRAGISCVIEFLRRRAFRRRGLMASRSPSAADRDECQRQSSISIVGTIPQGRHEASLFRRVTGSLDAERIAVREALACSPHLSTGRIITTEGRAMGVLPLLLRRPDGA